MKITNAVLNSFRDDFDKAMKPLIEKYGMDISLESISYSDYSFNGKVRVADTKAEFNNFCESPYASHLGITPDCLGRIYTHAGKGYQIIGCKPSSKYCLMIKDMNTGKITLCTPDFLGFN